MGRHRFVLAIRSGLLASFRTSANARESCENSLVEHRAVAIAIRERNPETAEQAMHTLLAGTSRDLVLSRVTGIEPIRRRPAPGRGARSSSNKPASRQLESR
jgi:FCD domain